MVDFSLDTPLEFAAHNALTVLYFYMAHREGKFDAATLDLLVNSAADKLEKALANSADDATVKAEDE